MEELRELVRGLEGRRIAGEDAAALSVEKWQGFLRVYEETGVFPTQFWLWGACYCPLCREAEDLCEQCRYVQKHGEVCNIRGGYYRQAWNLVFRDDNSKEAAHMIEGLIGCLEQLVEEVRCK